MMAAASDNSNWNGGAEMGVGGYESISSNLLNRLLLVSDTLILFGICSWQTCMVLVCVPSH